MIQLWFWMIYMLLCVYIKTEEEEEEIPCMMMMMMIVSIFSPGFLFGLRSSRSILWGFPFFFCREKKKKLNDKKIPTHTSPPHTHTHTHKHIGTHSGKRFCLARAASIHFFLSNEYVYGFVPIFIIIIFIGHQWKKKTIDPRKCYEHGVWCMVDGDSSAFISICIILPNIK